MALRPGMIVSNEPGYYKTGEYGIRIESLVVVAPLPISAGRRDHPLRLRDADARADRPRPRRAGLLTDAEIAWLDAYHARVREAIAPKVDPETAAWLTQATRPSAALTPA